MYRKFTADYIFTGTELLPKGTILITNADGVIADITTTAHAGDGIESFSGILSPGFINAHCHLELSHLKGLIPEHTGLVDFVFKIITQRNTGETEILQAIEKAEAAMLQNGIVAVGDICNTTHTAAQKLLNNLYYHNFIEATGFVPAGALKRFETAVEVFNQFNRLSSIAPHAPYSVSPQLFELINNYGNNGLLTMHNQETAAEDDFFKKGDGDFLRLYQQLGIDISFYRPTGKSSLQSVIPHLNKQQQLLLVHNVTTTENDIAFIQQSIQNKQLSSVYYCLCPNANLYISNRLPDVASLVKNNCAIVLGTDSLASNHQLSILEEMKTLQQHFPALTITQLLQWATLNGAKALQMEKTLGSFDIGKQPGVVLIENNNGLSLTNNTAAKRIL